MAVTPRLALYKPVGSDLANVEDHLNAQLDIIDDLAFKVFTNNLASPPVADFVGQEWFTSDTKEFFYWTGSAWVEISFDAIPISTGGAGRKTFNVATHITTIFNTSPTAENGPAIPTTINVEAGKSYRIIVTCYIISTDSSPTAVECHITVRWAVGAVVTNSGTLLEKKNCTISKSVAASSEGSYVRLEGIYTALVTQQVTFGVFILKPAGFVGSMAFASTTVGQVTGSYQFVYIEEL